MTERLPHAPIITSADILEILDELGVPHAPVPRQAFIVTVSAAPLPGPPEKSFIQILEETFKDDVVE